MILLPHTAGPDAHRLAEEFRAQTEAHDFRFHGETIPLTASFGVAALPDPSLRTLDAYFTRADQALYRAKRDGRNRVRGPEESS